MGKWNGCAIFAYVVMCFLLLASIGLIVGSGILVGTLSEPKRGKDVSADSFMYKIGNCGSSSCTGSLSNTASSYILAVNYTGFWVSSGMYARAFSATGEAKVAKYGTPSKGGYSLGLDRMFSSSYSSYNGGVTFSSSDFSSSQIYTVFKNLYDAGQQMHDCQVAFVVLSGISLLAHFIAVAVLATGFAMSAGLATFLSVVQFVGWAFTIAVMAISAPVATPDELFAAVPATAIRNTDFNTAFGFTLVYTQTQLTSQDQEMFSSRQGLFVLLFFLFLTIPCMWYCFYVLQRKLEQRPQPPKLEQYQKSSPNEQPVVYRPEPRAKSRFLEFTTEELVSWVYQNCEQDEKLAERCLNEKMTGSTMAQLCTGGGIVSVWTEIPLGVRLKLQSRVQQEVADGNSSSRSGKKDDKGEQDEDTKKFAKEVGKETGKQVGKGVLKVLTSI